MAHIEKYVCDQCGVEKGTNNHWFVALAFVVEFRLARWSKEAADAEATKHLCGQACVHKFVDEFLSK